MEGFIGEIKYFGGEYAPKNWAFCEGQTILIQQNTALYSIIANQFGGDGKTNFKLPDLRGRMPICAGQGSNLTLRTQGDIGGVETVQLTTTSIPIHNHVVHCDVASPPASQKNTPLSNMPAIKSTGTAFAPGNATMSNMNTGMIDNTGQNLAHENMPPFLALRYIICMYGYYPIRP
jgi:microcystin-dependent protein